MLQSAVDRNDNYRIKYSGDQIVKQQPKQPLEGKDFSFPVAPSVSVSGQFANLVSNVPNASKIRDKG